MTSYLLERAWVDGAVREDVLVEVEDGRFTSVQPEATSRATISPISRDQKEHFGGVTVPGFANAHSHVFHRALRGRTQRERGDFWTWRRQMYAVAERLDPDLLHRLARATYREMVAAGWTAVGEFHYLHHRPDGRPYADPHAMAHALAEAAREAGVRLTLLDTCYLAAGIGRPPEGVQRRFCDRSAEAWAERVDDLARALPGVTVGAAIHSVRAVPRDELPVVVAWAARHDAPLHVHLSEQVAENEECQAAYGLTPTRLLHDAGALGPRTTVVHATHLTDGDLALLGGAAVHACSCPTTERDLGDGIGPSTRLHEAGARLVVGTDSQAVVDPFEELRAVELDERLATRRRGLWRAADLLDAGTVHGHASLGHADAGRIAVGQRADLVTVDTASPRTAGAGRDEHAVVFAAGAADVTRVVLEGHEVEVDRDAVGRDLDAVLAQVWEAS